MEIADNCELTSVQIKFFWSTVYASESMQHS